jgi:hypothetical protein
MRCASFHAIVLLVSATSFAAEFDVATLAELERLAQQSGNVVRMKPGLYRFTDHINRDQLAARRGRGEFALMSFGGSDNRFELEGVTIEVDVSIRGVGRPPVHTSEFVFSGDRITISGLKITNVGHGLSLGGAVVSNTGNENTFEKLTLHVQGSSPYGYGDLFGKGGYKHSGFHLTGNDNRVIGCCIIMKSFGHGFYVQAGAANNLFQDCYVEGIMRPTDEMLAETSGLAFDRQFRTELKNRDGLARITPGYMKCLAEDGFRTYDDIPGLTIRNCTAKNMRGGFEMRTPSGATLENCTALGCERGFWVADRSVVKNCRGDAKYGPLLFVEGKDASVELTLLKEESESLVHALATVRGSGHTIQLSAPPDWQRKKPLPILVGYGAPPAGEAMAPYSQWKTSQVTFRNATSMPIQFGPLASDCQAKTSGPVTEDAGKNNLIAP